jgi:hypothetical protein
MTAMPPSSPKLSLKERMALKPLRNVYDRSDNLWGYRAAAAMLASFIAEELRPFQEEPSPEHCEQVLKECDVVSFSNAPRRWSLRTPVRQTMLVQLFERGLLAEALGVNPEMDDSTTQRIFERCVDPLAEPLSLPSTLESAASMLEVSYWLQPIAVLWSRLPSRDSLRQFIALGQLLEPFRNLVGPHFAGRRAELNILGDYVGVLEASSISVSVVRTFEKIFSLVKSPPLFVLGPGGVGKSTLIAQFVLEHVDAAGVAQFPFAYLDFDRSALLAEEPITLLFEVMRQLAVQYPTANARYKATIHKWDERVREQDDALEGGISGETDVADSGGGPQDSATGQRDGGDSTLGIGLSDRNIFMTEFVDFVQQLQPNAPDQPMLLVLDTFEEVQFRSSASEDDVFNFLDQLQVHIPRLRTVICGRTEITSTRYKVKELKLGNFDTDAAIAFLEMLLIKDTALAAKIVSQVGTSPLVLRLAADVARKEEVGSSGIKGLRPGWLDIFSSEMVEVVLYKRILAHVYDKRVQRLANPGLVLRFITPEVLLGILGPACDVSIADMADARGLVKTMRSQLATILVPHGGTNKLAHRPDMRAILLADLTARSKKEDRTAALLQRIHSLAVDFYAKYEDDESRAEELFHRLWLNQDRSILKARWRDEAGPYLGSGILELSLEAQAFVAGRAGFEVSGEVWNKAGEEDWALLAARRVHELVRSGKPLDASALMLQRAHKFRFEPSDPLFTRIIEEILNGYARYYEAIRSQYPSGDERTRLMDGIVARLREFAGVLRLDGNHARSWFARGSDGDRIVGLALAQSNPQLDELGMAIDAIGNARTPFEQYHGLMLAELFKEIPPQQQLKLRQALLEPSGTPIHSSDRSRTNSRDRLLKRWAEPLQM